MKTFMGFFLDFIGDVHGGLWHSWDYLDLFGVIRYGLLITVLFWTCLGNTNSVIKLLARSVYQFFLENNRIVSLVISINWYVLLYFNVNCLLINDKYRLYIDWIFDTLSCSKTKLILSQQTLDFSHVSF